MPTVTGYFRSQSYVLQQISTNIPGQTTSVSVTDGWSFSFGISGTGADQNTLYAATTLHLTGSPQVIDLTTLTDPYGIVCGFTNIHWIAIKHLGTTDLTALLVGWNTVQAGAHTGFVSNPGQLSVYPSTASNNGFTIFTAPNQTGAPVGGIYGTQLQFDPQSQTFDVDLQIAGYSMPDFTKLPFPYVVGQRILPSSGVPRGTRLVSAGGTNGILGNSVFRN